MKLAAGDAALADLDLDGDLDLMVCAMVQHGDGTLTLYYNSGDGTFSGREDHRTGGGPVDVAATDLDGDGWPDIAVGNEYRHCVHVFLNNGDGTFQASTDYPAGKSPAVLSVADLNGDGRPDIVSNNAVTMWVLLNAGAP